MRSAPGRYFRTWINLMTGGPVNRLRSHRRPAAERPATTASPVLLGRCRPAWFNFPVQHVWWLILRDGCIRCIIRFYHRPFTLLLTTWDSRLVKRTDLSLWDSRMRTYTPAAAAWRRQRAPATTCTYLYLLLPALPGMRTPATSPPAPTATRHLPLPTYLPACLALRAPSY